MKNIICLVVDRLHSGMVGAYGNAWIRTPCIDRLAGQAFLFDQAVIDSPRLERFYRAAWRGATEVVSDRLAERAVPLPVLLKRNGIFTALIADDRAVVDLPDAASFGERIALDPPADFQAADDVFQTQTARLFAAADQWLSEPREPFCLWLHARGFSGPWDAPYELRARYADEEDPSPPDFVEVPDYRLANDYDPDLLLGIVQAYAGQASAIDELLGAFLARLDETPAAARTAAVLLSPRGIALGEHGRIGPCGDSLHAEIAQIPWLMRFPDRLGALARTQALVTPADLPHTLLDWLEIKQDPLAPGGKSLLGVIRGDEERVRDRLVQRSDGEIGLRTSYWQLRVTREGEEERRELYSKPSDRWEVNEVADRAEAQATALREALDAGLNCQEGEPLPPLAELLETEVD